MFTQAAKARGIAALILDHVPKDTSNKTQRGGGRKKDMADVQWRLSLIKPFNRISQGQVSLDLEKDREGWLPRSQVFNIGGGESGLSEDEQFVCRPVGGTFELAGKDGLTNRARAALEALKEFGTIGGTSREWRHRIKVSRQTIDRARNELLKKRLIERVRDSDKYRVISTQEGSPGGGPDGDGLPPDFELLPGPPKSDENKGGGPGWPSVGVGHVFSLSMPNIESRLKVAQGSPPGDGPPRPLPCERRSRKFSRPEAGRIGNTSRRVVVKEPPCNEYF